jgi:hypothetical protein
MIHGGASFNSQAPQVLQCSANISRASSRTLAVGGLPTRSTLTAGARAMDRIGPMILALQNSAPFRSRLTQASIRYSAIPHSSFGNAIMAPRHRALEHSRLFVAGSTELPIVLVKTRAAARQQPAVRRGYAGAVQHDCIRHDDYRSADFSGPMVTA